MIPLLTVAQVRAAEQKAIKAGTSESELMRRAGTAIAEAIHESNLSRPGSALILSGPGNNGGDGIVVAERLASNGWTVSIWTHGRDGISGAPVEEESVGSIQWLPGTEDAERVASACDVVIDAVFGAGSRAELPEDVRKVFDAIASVHRRRRFAIWAVDVPSGVESDSGAVADGALQADVTAMIGSPKVGAFQFPAAAFTGSIRLIDIGLPASNDVSEDTPRLLSAEDARQSFPTRRAGIHKRSAGTLMIVGGAPSYYGAPRLAGEASLRAGAGLVSVAAPSSIIAPMATAVPELTFVPLPVGEHGTAGDRMAKLVREKLPEMNALVVGPGLGTDAPVPDFLSLLFGFGRSVRRGIGFGSITDPETIEPFTGKAVLDADALNWLSSQDEWWKSLADANLVLTPHPGELARLLGREREDIEGNPWEYAGEAAAKFGQVVVLKYGHTVIASPDGRLKVAPTAPPSLATAGSGDVLSGIIGSLLAQGLEPEPAACTGVLLGLAATELAERRTGPVGMLATDIIASLPAARESLIRSDELLN